MGKKLIIKGADFSANSFTYNVITESFHKVYLADGSEIPDVSGSNNCYMRAIKTNQSSFNKLTESLYLSDQNNITCGVLGIPAEDWQTITINKMNSYSASGGQFLFIMPLTFIDDNYNILNGLAYANSESYVKEYVSDLSTLKYNIKYGFTPVTIEDLRYEIPGGTSMIYVSAAFKSQTDKDNFEITLYKYE